VMSQDIGNALNPHWVWGVGGFRGGGPGGRLVGW
jgi:hypothetical protein